MRLRQLVALLGLWVLLLPCGVTAEEQEDLRTQIEEIRQQLSQMDELKAKLADLEKRLEESEKARAETNSVGTGFPGVKAKIDGRIFVGLFDSGDQGSYDNWSTDIPDAKLRFTFMPSDRITIVNRLSANGAQAGDFDYFYLDYARLFGPANTLRLGQRKIDVGQETWMNSPQESFVVTNSVSNVGGYGTGIALVGRFGETTASPLYEVGYINGPRGVMVRPTSSIPYNVKIGAPLPNDLFASVSWFDSGKLRAGDNSAISVADLSGAPSGASEWRRTLWELDLRYNQGPNGYRAVVPWGDLPKTMWSAAYGQFNDNAVGVADRDGAYWYVEGLVRLSPRLYTAARYSIVDLDDGVLANLSRSPVAVNSYARTSLGLGYKLSDLTVLKTEYAFNNTSGGASEPSLNQWALGVASKF